MGTPLRAIEMSDSSGLGINPSLAVEESACMSLNVCIYSSCLCVCLPLGKNLLSFVFLHLIEEEILKHCM